MAVELLVGQNITELSDIRYEHVCGKLMFTEVDINMHVNKVEKAIINMGTEQPSVVNAILDL